MNSKAADDSFRYGSLPENAPLAMAYVPIQCSAEPHYSPDEALSAGTLFPGLNLPFMNINGGKLPKTALNELSAIDFACDELGLYLDTHSNDREAFEMYRTFLELSDEAHERYKEKFGPVTKADMMDMKEYSWLREPWPWDYKKETGVF